MLTLAADENFKEQIVNGLRRRLPGIDIATVRSEGLVGILDPGVLAWAAEEGRVVVTHDTRTMRTHAYERVAAGRSMPGVVEVTRPHAIGQAIEELLQVVQVLEPEEMKDRVLRLPL